MIRSFSVVATHEVWKELAVMIFTVRRFHDQPIYVLCDSGVKEKLEGFNFSEVVFDVDADPKHLVEEVASNGWVRGGLASRDLVRDTK